MSKKAGSFSVTRQFPSRCTQTLSSLPPSSTYQPALARCQRTGMATVQLKVFAGNHVVEINGCSASANRQHVVVEVDGADSYNIQPQIHHLECTQCHTRTHARTHARMHFEASFTANCPFHISLWAAVDLLIRPLNNQCSSSAMATTASRFDRGNAFLFHSNKCMKCLQPTGIFVSVYWAVFLTMIIKIMQSRNDNEAFNFFYILTSTLFATLQVLPPSLPVYVQEG